MSSIYYKPSGRYSFFSLSMLFCCGLLCALLLTIIYIALQWIIPFIYLNLFLAIGLALVAFKGLGFLHKLFKLRNVNMAFLSSGFIMLIAFYFHWVIFALLMFGESREQSITYLWSSLQHEADFWFLFSHPTYLLRQVSTLNAQGTFSINGMLIQGWLLWGIWFIEAVLLIGIPILSQIFGQVFKPFSEKNLRWMRLRKLPAYYPYIDDVAMLEQALLLGDTTCLQPLVNNGEHPAQYAQLFVYEDPKDTYQYLLVYNIRTSKTRRGALRKHKVPIIEYLRLRANTL